MNYPSFIFRLICSDLMARGLDLQNVENVINYDIPKFVKTYVHRCGRTARANKSGSAFTIATREESGTFLEMLEKVERGDKLKSLDIEKSTLKELSPKYQQALQHLKETIATEQKSKYAVPKKRKQTNKSGEY